MEDIICVEKPCEWVRKGRRLAACQIALTLADWTLTSTFVYLFDKTNKCWYQYKSEITRTQAWKSLLLKNQVGTTWEQYKNQKKKFYSFLGGLEIFY